MEGKDMLEEIFQLVFDHPEMAITFSFRQGVFYVYFDQVVRGEKKQYSFAMSLDEYNFEKKYPGHISMLFNLHLKRFEVIKI